MENNTQKIYLKKTNKKRMYERILTKSIQQCVEENRR